MTANVSEFVICRDNTGYQASLEIGKRYSVIPDQDAEKLGGILVIDEDGEVYFYDSEMFSRLQVPPVEAKC